LHFSDKEGLEFRNKLAIMHFNENVLAHLKKEVEDERTRVAYNKGLKKDTIKKIRLRALQLWKEDIRLTVLRSRKTDMRSVKEILKEKLGTMTAQAEDETPELGQVSILSDEEEDEESDDAEDVNMPLPIKNA
jgi:hypothetical protein